MKPISDDALDRIFREARTASHWLDEPVAPDILRRIYASLKFGPTSANCSPARFLFLQSQEAKERLKPALAPGNVDKTMSAPIVAVVAQDMEFYEKLPQLFPHTDARSWFTGNDELIRSTAFRNGTLQGAYLILAARAEGLDTGPMSGFDNAKLDAEFFAGTPIRSNFLVNLGYGDRSKLRPRGPRLEFDEACEIL